MIILTLFGMVFQTQVILVDLCFCQTISLMVTEKQKWIYMQGSIVSCSGALILCQGLDSICIIFDVLKRQSG